MPDHPTIADFDRDEAFAEAQAGLAEATTRSTLLRRVGLLAGGGLVAGAVPLSNVFAQGGLSKGDKKILNYALTLEYLESAFYQSALSKGKLSGPAQTFAQTAGAHEATHVTALQKVLGSDAGKKPKFGFGEATGSQKMFLSTAKTLEDTGVSAYQGQAGNIKATQVLATAGSILAVEARHASWVRDIIAGGKTPKPAPEAFSPALTMSDVLSAVKKTGFIKS